MYKPSGGSKPPYMNTLAVRTTKAAESIVIQNRLAVGPGLTVNRRP